MKIKTRITELFNIKYPIIQAGMVWASGWKLASAVSNAGGLGLIGAGSMKPDLLREHIQKCKEATPFPFGVNVPQLREDAAELIKVIVEENINIVFTSAGSPSKFIDFLKNNNAKVVHVVSSLKFALKAQDAGCDAVVGEGVEAGGHNGYDEITTMCLIPNLCANLNIPVIAAGGISNGRQILAALSLGAEAVQMGTRFAATIESSAHTNYKNTLLNAKENSTVLALKKIALVRMIKNEFADTALSEEFEKCKSKNELLELLGKKRERSGIFEGDINEGMMEAGQSAVLINDIPYVKDLMASLIDEIKIAKDTLNNLFI
ncbi:MAG: nitronate monooxygenase [Bacteroidota bacterium]|nr:nitronate monooxygenase [Bacteroidota bacterium]